MLGFVLIAWAAAVVVGVRLGIKYDDVGGGFGMSLFLGWIGVAIYWLGMEKRLKDRGHA